jgi:outer membrane protein OmpA-like peptidoglycan-associated protein
MRNQSRVTPYVNALFGGVYLTASTAVSATPASSSGTARQYLSQNAFAMALGGGFDIRVSKYVSLRPAGLDYFMTRLQNPSSLQDNNQHHFRYSAGINFTFGRESPAPLPAPPQRTCWDGSSVPVGSPCPHRNMDLRVAASQTEVCPGTAVQITPSGVADGATLDWSVNGQPAGRSSTHEFSTAGLAPGAYKIAVTAAALEYNNASAEVAVTVLPYTPPSGTLQVSPPEIWVGEQATITASFSSGQCTGAVSAPAISAAEGSVSGNRYDSSGVQFDPSDNAEQRKTVGLEARVRDERGEAAAAGSVVVKKKAVVQPTRLADIVFPARSARVNNCGKRVLLEDLGSFIQRDPDGRVVLVGHISDSEKAPDSLAQERALNAAAVISAGQGICGSLPASRILIAAVGAADNGVDPQPHFCGTSVNPRTPERRGASVKDSDDTAKFRRVEVWFIPTGGITPPSAPVYQDASTLPLNSLGCPK